MSDNIRIDFGRADGGHLVVSGGEGFGVQIAFDEAMAAGLLGVAPSGVMGGFVWFVPRYAARDLAEAILARLDATE